MIIQWFRLSLLRRNSKNIFSVVIKKCDQDRMKLGSVKNTLLRNVVNNFRRQVCIFILICCSTEYAAYCSCITM